MKTTTIIYMADDVRPKGGIADRFRAIITLYKISKDCGFQFKINYTQPFDLSDFLLPNIVDWKISEKEISQIKNNSRSVSIFNFGGCIYAPSLYSDVSIQSTSGDLQKDVPIIKEAAKNNDYILFYTNAYFYGDNYSTLFNELFVLTPILQSAVDLHRKNMNDNYLSATFRFQQLLGDFDEHDDGFLTLPEELQEPFLQKNIKHLINIHKRNKKEKILLCSDSEKFRNAAAKYDFVYTIDGKRQHLNIPKMDKKYALISFVDYFLISYSKKSFLVVDEIKGEKEKYEMYRSGFPLWASRQRNVKFVIKDYRASSIKITIKNVIPRWIKHTRFFMALTKKWVKIKQQLKSLF